MTEEKRKYLRFEVIVPVDLIEVEGVSGADAEAISRNSPPSEPSSARTSDSSGCLGELFMGNHLSLVVIGAAV